MRTIRISNELQGLSRLALTTLSLPEYCVHRQPGLIRPLSSPVRMGSFHQSLPCFDAGGTVLQTLVPGLGFGQQSAPVIRRMAAFQHHLKYTVGIVAPQLRPPYNSAQKLVIEVSTVFFRT